MDDMENTDWPTRCVDDAAASVTIPSTAKELIADQLSGKMQQQSLKVSELRELAEALIEAVKPQKDGDAA